MQTKFQSSILINNKLFWKGGPSAPQKGRIAAHVRVNPNVGISFFSIYAYKISALYLDKQKSGAFGPKRGPFRGPGGVNPYICISMDFIWYEQYAYQILIFYLDK